MGVGRKEQPLKASWRRRRLSKGLGLHHPARCHDSNSFLHLLFTTATLAAHGFGTLRMWLVLANWSRGLQAGMCGKWEPRVELNTIVNLFLFVGHWGTSVCLTSVQSAEGVGGGLLSWG